MLEELIEEILLRFPPDEPASLFRACLVCKPWCRLISGHRFGRRYREFHRTPPILGFLCSELTTDFVYNSRFVATSSCPPLANRHSRFLDARHGHVLLCHNGGVGKEEVLIVWDPITDEKSEIQFPKLMWPACPRTAAAAVVCAAAAAGGRCEHLHCHRGAFLVVYVVSSYSAETFIWTYASDTGLWSDPISTQQHEEYVYLFSPSVLVGNALYFAFLSKARVVKYDLEFHEVSVVGLLPPSTSFYRTPDVLRTTEDGRLGLATIHESKLYMWSKKDGAEADVVWTCDRVTDLETLLSSIAILTEPILVGFVDRIGVILLRADNVLYTVDLRTSKLKKVCDEARSIHTVVPYMSFCTPALVGGLTMRDQVPVSQVHEKNSRCISACQGEIGL